MTIEICGYPNGCLTDDDRGETEIRLGLAPLSEPRAVVIDFGKPTRWIGMTAPIARELAAKLVELADKLERGE
jgi:Mg-chelatase subunit ChlD